MRVKAATIDAVLHDPVDTKTIEDIFGPSLFGDVSWNFSMFFLFHTNSSSLHVLAFLEDPTALERLQCGSNRVSNTMKQIVRTMSRGTRSPFRLYEDGTTILFLRIP
jgi:hypothetical protein